MVFSGNFFRCVNGLFWVFFEGLKCSFYSLFWGSKVQFLVTGLGDLGAVLKCLGCCYLALDFDNGDDYLGCIFGDERE